MSPSQRQALEDTERSGNPWARVHGQSQHGGWNSVMRVIEFRRKWVRYDKKKRKYVLTDAGHESLRVDRSI